jgi:hypothetical protein
MLATQAPSVIETGNKHSRKLEEYKLLKKKSRNTVQQAQCLLSNHRVVLLWFTQSLAVYWGKLPAVDHVNSQGFSVSFAVRHFVRNVLWQKYWGSRKSENGPIFQRVSVFFNSLSHTPDFHVQHTKLLQSRPKSHGVYMFAMLAIYLALFWQQGRFTKSCENQGCSLTCFE